MITQTIKTAIAIVCIGVGITAPVQVATTLQQDDITVNEVFSSYGLDFDEIANGTDFGFNGKTSLVEAAQIGASNILTSVEQSSIDWQEALAEMPDVSIIFNELTEEFRQ